MTNADPQNAREEIARARTDLDKTVDAIAYKADLPARAADSIGGRIESIKATFDEGARPDRPPSPATDGGLGLALGAFAIGCAVGALVPVSTLERERAAALGDRLAEAATNRLGEKIARVKGAIVRGRANFRAA